MSEPKTPTLVLLAARHRVLTKRLAAQTRSLTAHKSDSAAHQKAIETWTASIQRPDPDAVPESTTVLSARIHELEKFCKAIGDAHDSLPHIEIQSTLITLQRDVTEALDRLAHINPEANPITIDNIITDISSHNARITDALDRIHTLERVDLPDVRDQVTSAQAVQKIVAQTHARYPHLDIDDQLQDHAQRLHNAEGNLKDLLADPPPFDPDHHVLTTDELVRMRAAMVKMATFQRVIAEKLTLILGKLS